MGCGGSKEAVDEGPPEESAESKALNEQLEREQKQENRIIKLLVLGKDALRISSLLLERASWWAMSGSGPALRVVRRPIRRDEPETPPLCPPDLDTRTHTPWRPSQTCRHG